MATGRRIRAGETIKLRALFKDDLGDPAEASSVFVHIFDADVIDFDDLNNATVVSGVATFLGEGIHEFEYSVPGDGPDGIWQDHWEGTLTGQALEAQLQFEVSASGIIESLSDQLFNNNIVKITVSSGIQATDGSTLEEEFEMEFLTTTAPSYTNTRKIRLEIGAYIQTLEDDLLQLAILEASLEADVLTFNKTTKINEPLFKHARREYTTCLASSLLLINLGQFLLKTKTLDNLHVEYDTKGVQIALNKIRDCLEKWEPQILSGGGAKAIRSPRGVVKGSHDPDRPAVGRMWQSTEWGTISRRMPAANDRQKPQGRRRYLATYRKKWW